MPFPDLPRLSFFISLYDAICDPCHFYLFQRSFLWIASVLRERVHAYLPHVYTLLIMGYHEVDET